MLILKARISETVTVVCPVTTIRVVYGLGPRPKQTIPMWIASRLVQGRRIWQCGQWSHGPMPGMPMPENLQKHSRK